MTPTAPIHRPCRTRGLTLVECVMASLIVGIAMVGAMRSVSASRMGERRLTGARLAQTLAQDLLDEITGQPYTGAGDTSTVFGPNSGESTANRGDFNDVNDYINWTESPPKTKAGSSLGYNASWTRAVQVSFVSPTDPNVASAADQGLARVTVTVSHDGVTLASISTLRSAGLAATEACKLPSGTWYNLVPAHNLALGGTSKGPGTNIWTLPEAFKTTLFYSVSSPRSVQVSLYDEATRTWGAASNSGAASVTPIWASAAAMNDSTVVLTSNSGNGLFYGLANADGSATYSSICSDTGSTNCRPFDAAVEASSGNGLIAYYDKPAADTRYRTISGSTLSSPASMGCSAKDLTWVRLTPMGSAGNDVMAMMVAGNKSLHAARWSSGTWTAHTTLTTSMNNASNEEAAMAVEGLSGRVQAVFSDSGSNRVGWRIYTPGSGWSSIAYLAGLGGGSRWVRLASRSGTNEIYLAVMVGNQNVLGARWNGSSWSTPQVLVNSTGSLSVRGFDVACSPDGSSAMVVYGKGGSAIYYRLWTGSTWSAEATAFGLASGSNRTVTARPSSSDATVVGAVGDSNGGVNAWSWNGASFGAVSRLGTTSTSYASFEWFAIAAGKP